MDRKWLYGIGGIAALGIGYYLYKKKQATATTTPTTVVGAPVSQTDTAAIDGTGSAPYDPNAAAGYYQPSSGYNGMAAQPSNTSSSGVNTFPTFIPINATIPGITNVPQAA